MIVCTVTCADNLHEAKVMASSVKKHMPYARIVICLVERHCHPAAQRVPWFDEVILAKNLGVPDFEQRIFKYGLLEAVTSLKPTLLSHLLKRHPKDTVLFMDSDICVYHPFDDLLSALKNHSILLTPQQTEAKVTWAAHLRFGIYNTGMLGVRNTPEAWRFLVWWEQRLRDYCYRDEPLFVDQRWMDITPALFDVHIFTHPGYNVAGWNLMEDRRRLSLSDTGILMMNDKPLCCFHFSGLSGFLQHWISIAEPDGHGLLHGIVHQFMVDIAEMGQAELEQEPWSYDYFESGELIDPNIRRLYGSNPDVGSLLPVPFASSNEIVRRVLQEGGV